MNFLSPLFLAGAAAAVVPLVLHLLRRQPEPRVKFGAVKLLKLAPVEQTGKRHLRELLLLALRAAALVLLASAFARPFFATGGVGGVSGVTIVALDTSYSLSAPGRFERARSLATDAIRQAPSTNFVGVVTFADEAEIAATPSRDRAPALAAVERAAVTFGATRYQSGLSAAARSLEGSSGTIVVVTDLQETGWNAGDVGSVPESTRIEVRDVGPPPPNLAVTAVSIRDGRIVATVRNSGPAPRDSRVRFVVDGRPTGEVALSIGPHQTSDATADAPVRGAMVAVTIDDPGGIQVDNTRYALVESVNQASVLLVTATADPDRGAFYVRQALEAGSARSEGYRVASSSAVQLSVGPDDRLRSHAAIALLSTRGLDRRGREALRSFARNGGGLLIAAGPDVDGDLVSDVLGDEVPLTVAVASNAVAEPRSLAPADIRHPMFQPFRPNPAALGLVTFHRVARISGSRCQTIARFTTGEDAMLDCSTGERRVLVFGSDLDDQWNDFPLHSTFVPFLHQALRYLTSSRSRAGEYLIGAAPAGVPRRPGAAVLPATPDGRPSRAVVVNVDPREGDPTRMSAEEFVSAIARVKGAGVPASRVETAQQEDRQHLWQYLLVLMVAVLAVEGIVASRTA